MMTHVTGTPKDWLAARLDLLRAEKALTRRSDELARQPQELPWVRIDKEYRFETDEGSASLADLFRGRSQLLVYNFMFGSDCTSASPSCAAVADGFDDFVVHLGNHDVAMTAISRAPFDNLQAVKRWMRWTFPWASSCGSEFNFDFSAGFTEEQQREPALRGSQGSGAEMPVRSMSDSAFAALTGTDVGRHLRERPGVSAFVYEDGVVYCTHSAYSRGFDALMGMYQWLDRVPRGRSKTGSRLRRHDEYDKC